MGDLERCALKDRALHRAPFVHLAHACFLRDQVGGPGGGGWGKKGEID